MKPCRHLVADRTVRADHVVVSTPILAFFSRFVEAHEPVDVQAFGSELAIQGFDEGVVGWFSGTAKVERDAPHEGPEIQFLADKLRAVVQANRLWMANFQSSFFQCGNNVGSFETLP